MWRVLLVMWGAVCLGQGVEEANKAAARRYYEQAWIGGNPEAARDLFAPKYRAFDPRGRMGVEEDAETQVSIARQWCVVHGDCSKSEILYQVAEGDKVATYWVFRQKQKRMLQAMLAGVLGRDPLERRIVNIFRFKDGRVIETYNQRDDLGIYSDLGLVNFAILVLWALGGASGIGLTWLMNRIAKRRA